MSSSQPTRDPLRKDQLTRRAALLIAEAQMTDDEIASAVGVSKSMLKTWKKSPLFKELVAQMGAKIIDEGVKSITDRIMDDAPQNLSFLQRTRDGEFHDEEKRMGVRLQAAKMLFDRQAPTSQGSTQAAVGIVINARLMNQVARAMKNDGMVLDAEFEEITDETVRAKTTDELAAEERAMLFEESPEDD